MLADEARRALDLVREELRNAELAIHSHPEGTVALFERHRAALGRTSYEWAAAVVPGIADEEAAVVDAYMLAMSFISAWYSRHGEKAKRDSSSQAAASLVATVGFDGAFAFKAILDYEKEWRELFARNEVGKNAGCAPAILLAASAIAGLSSLFA